MRIRKDATDDGGRTVFVGAGLGFSDLSGPAADALAAAFARFAAAKA